MLACMHACIHANILTILRIHYICAHRQTRQADKAGRQGRQADAHTAELGAADRAAAGAGCEEDGADGLVAEAVRAEKCSTRTRTELVEPRLPRWS